MSDAGPSQDGKVETGHVSVSGGCGAVGGHAIEVDEDGRPYIDCTICGPKLVGSHYGWAATPAGVPLTPDELSERDLAERDGVAMQRIVLKSVTDSLVTAASAQKGLVGQIRSLSAADKAELLAALRSDDGDDPKPKGLSRSDDRAGVKEDVASKGPFRKADPEPEDDPEPEPRVVAHKADPAPKAASHHAPPRKS